MAQRHATRQGDAWSIQEFPVVVQCEADQQSQLGDMPPQTHQQTNSAMAVHGFPSNQQTRSKLREANPIKGLSTREGQQLVNDTMSSIGGIYGKETQKSAYSLFTKMKNSIQYDPDFQNLLKTPPANLSATIWELAKSILYVKEWRNDGSYEWKFSWQSFWILVCMCILLMVAFYYAWNYGSMEIVSGCIKTLLITNLTKTLLSSLS